jgi:hypothetical protein
MNNNKNRKAERLLTAGDTFIFNGEVGTFVCWSGPSFIGVGGSLRRQAVVSTPDNLGGVRWSLNMAGSVELV